MSFVVIFCNYISFHFGKLLAFLLGCALVSFIHPLVLLCFPNFVYDCIALQFFLLGVVLSFLFICYSFFFLSLVFHHSFVILLPFVSTCCCPFLVLVLHSIHPLVQLYFHTFVYDCILLSFLFLHCFFFWSFACLCMITSCCGLCTLLSFGCVVVFLIPPWFISFLQSKELHVVAFVVLGFFLSGILLSFLFCHHSFHLPNQMNGISLWCFSLFCFVLADLLSSLFVQRFFVYQFKQMDNKLLLLCFSSVFFVFFILVCSLFFSEHFKFVFVHKILVK